MGKTPVAIIGSGNIGTDLLMKISGRSETLEVVAFVGIDPESEGLKRAAEMGVPICATGIEGLIEMPKFDSIAIAFDATSAGAHRKHHESMRAHGKKILDLTPAAIGPYVVPTVNLSQHLDVDNVNLVTCGGQATIPMVHAVNRMAPVSYAEIVASISSRSAGPGTRANIDEFTQTTARGLETVGGAKSGKAIIVLNPASPPILMRNTVFCFVEGEPDTKAIRQSISEMEQAVQDYVPGYRLKQEVQFDSINAGNLPETVSGSRGCKVTIYLEVEGAGDFLPAYAGNLDIMTSAALATAEKWIAKQTAAPT